MAVPLLSGLVSRGFACAGFQLVEQDRCGDAHAVQALHAGELQHGGDLFPRRAGLQRALDVPAHARRVQVRARGVERDADELDRLRVERAGDGGRDRERDHLLGPGRIELGERLPVRIPVAARLSGACASAAGSLSVSVVHGGSFCHGHAGWGSSPPLGAGLAPWACLRSAT